MIHHTSCNHERHQGYTAVFDGAHVEHFYLRKLSEFVMDPKLSHKDPEDLELFQDLVFEGPSGRIHIFYYEEYYRNHGRLKKQFAENLNRYLLYLNELSSLFTRDAFLFVLKKENSSLIDAVLESLSFELKMDFIKEAQKQPKIIQLSDKLKLYNLFS